MTDSIYSTTGQQRISAVCLRHTVNLATLTLEQNDYLVDKPYSESINVVAPTGGGSAVTVVVSGVTGRRIVVDNYLLSPSGACTAKFVSSTGNYLTGTLTLTGSGNLTGEDANLTSGIGENFGIYSDGNIGGHITYRIV